MNTFLIILIAGILYFLFYFLWGKRLANRLLRVNDKHPVPSLQLKDNIDFVPTHKAVLFGHHFASIAGAAPIVGPVIALAWGWVPALLWVWFGNILIGAIHDYLSLMASVRHEGRSIEWISAGLISKRTSMLFRVFVLLTLILIIGAFAAIIAAIFANKPQVGSASVFFIIAAVLTGIFLYRLNLPLWLGTIIGLILTALAIFLGIVFPITLTVNQWLLILLFYMTVAASLPVWILLQPRDYLNAYLLWCGLFIGGLALIFLHKNLSLPGFTIWSAPTVAGVPSPFWPTIPLIIACGALSGFHSLVSSGTTSKQLAKESDALFVGMGGMFTEGFLSTVVIASVGAFGLAVLTKHGLSFQNPSQFAVGYGVKLKEVGGPVGLFSLSFGETLAAAFRISSEIAAVFASLWVSAFALTTLDTTTRIGRFTLHEVLEPLSESVPNIVRFFTNFWVASFLVSLLGTALAWGALWRLLWPAFGGANQMLASIALMTVTVWVLLTMRHAGIIYKLAVALPTVLLWVTITSALLWYLWVPLKKFMSTNPLQAWILAIIVIIELTLNVILFVDAFKSVAQKWRTKEIPAT